MVDAALPVGTGPAEEQPAPPADARRRGKGRYKRDRIEGPAPRRDKWWRNDFHTAVHAAARAGEFDDLTVSVPTMVAFLTGLAGFSSHSGEDRILYRSTIGTSFGRSSQTVTRAANEAARLGWIDRAHRVVRREDGTFQGLPNEWRLQIPAHHETARVVRKTNARNSRPAQPARPTAAAAAVVVGTVAATAATIARNEARTRGEACPQCDGSLWVSHADTHGLVRCPACTSADPGPP